MSSCRWRWRAPSRRAQPCRSASCVSAAASRSNWTHPSMCSIGSQSRNLLVCVSIRGNRRCCEMCEMYAVLWRCNAPSVMCLSVLLSPAGHSDPQQTGGQHWGGDSTGGRYSRKHVSVCDYKLKRFSLGPWSQADEMDQWCQRSWSSFHTCISSEILRRIHNPVSWLGNAGLFRWLSKPCK